MNFAPPQHAQSNRKGFFNDLRRSTVALGFWFALAPTLEGAKITQNQFIDNSGQIVRFYKPEP
jgi:hypothetical protein